jgi:hypothetical protein
MARVRLAPSLTIEPLMPLQTLFVLHALAAAVAVSRPAEPAPARWLEVFRSADYRVSLDTANVDRRPDGTFRVRYETWHLRGDVDAGLHFNREEVQSELRCTPVGFRTLAISLFLDHGPELVRRSGAGATPGAPWQTPGPQSVDLKVMREACRILYAPR